MSMVHHVTLSRELRFGLDEAPSAASAASRNGFAGDPALVGIAPFLTLRAQLSGIVDERTGMLTNIKLVDRVLSDVAVPRVRDYVASPGPRGGADLLRDLRPLVATRLEALAPGRATLDALTLSLSPYLTLTCLSKDPAMVRMTERFEFSAAHRLHSPALTEQQNAETFGHCTNPNGHGHNYELEVTIEGQPDAKTGLILPVLEFQRIVNQRVVDAFDHKHLNLDCPEFATLNPTVENIARVAYERLAPGFTGAVKLASVRVWETPKTWAEYSTA